MVFLILHKQAYSGDPRQTVRYAASDLDLHCICITIKTLCLIHGLNQLLNFVQGLNIYFDF